MPIRIDLVACAELPALAAAAETEPEIYPVVPIDRQRAWAQLQNPVAVADDPTLVVAYRDGRCVGYLGLLPQRLRRGQTTLKALSFSTLYLHPTLRGSGLATRMLDAARSPGLPLLTIGNSLAAQAFFSKNGMRRLPPQRIGHLRLGPGAAVSDQFERALRLLRRMGLPAMQPAASALKRMSLQALEPWRHRANVHARRTLGTPANLRVVAVDAFRDGVETPTDARNLRVHWDSATLNWMLACPWIRTRAPEHADAASRYHFNTVDPGFRHAGCELVDAEGQLAGFAAATLHVHHAQKVVSLLQSASATTAGQAMILGYAIDLARENHADIVRCGQQWLEPLRQAGLGNRLRVVERHSFVDAPMHADAFTDYAEDFADGDIAFY